MIYYFVMCILFLTLGIVGITWLNVLCAQRRSKMSPEERRLEDEETQREMQIW